MKKITLLFILLCISLFSFAKEDVEVKYTAFGKEYSVIYSPNSRAKYLVEVNDSDGDDITYILFKNDRNVKLFVESLMETHAKFIEWSEVAKKNKVKILLMR